MSITKEESGRRSVQVEVEVPGTPEQVWAAIATGPGVSAWFVPTEIEEREGGAIVSHFAPGMDAAATVTEWAPPHRFLAEGGDLGPGSPPLATEWIVEPRSGGTCVVRVVHSLFADSDDWDGQLTSVESGWPGFFRVLRMYLAHFRGQRCSILQTMAFTAGPEDRAWAALTDRLGLTGVGEGERWIAPDDPAETPPFAGTVERVGDSAGFHDLLLLLDQPAPGTAVVASHTMGPQVHLMISAYLYGEEVAAVVERDGPRWQAWMQALFPPASPA